MGATSEHFQATELCCRCPRHGDQPANECKPELLYALEKLRMLVGKPIILNSAYRCPEHNTEAGGAPKSEHVQGIAADIRVEGVSARTLESYARVSQAFNGIGRDDHKGFVHVDVRATVAQWCYDVEGVPETYYS